MDIKVVYALRERQWLIALNVASTTTLGEAVQLSGLLEQVPESERLKLTFGINGKVKPTGTLLRPGDRVEMYRPRLVNPKEQRRQRI